MEREPFERFPYMIIQWARICKGSPKLKIGGIRIYFQRIKIIFGKILFPLETFSRTQKDHNSCDSKQRNRKTSQTVVSALQSRQFISVSAKCRDQLKRLLWAHRMIVNKCRVITLLRQEWAVTQEVWDKKGQLAYIYKIRARQTLFFMLLFCICMILRSSLAQIKMNKS